MTVADQEAARSERVPGTLADLLFEAPPGAAPDDALVHRGSDTFTRSHVVERATAIAEAVAGAGVRTGQAVAVCLGDPADVVTALFGVWRAGAVYVPVNPRLSPVETRRLIVDVRPAAVIEAGDTGATGMAGDAGVVVRPAPSGVTPRQHEPGIALVQMTSGTTGRPKPVLLRHDGVLALMDGVLRKLGVEPRRGGDDRRPPMPNLIPVSLSLWAGIYNVLFALRVGAPVVLMERFTPRGFADLVRRFEIRSVVLPPAAMVMLTDDRDVDDLSPLRLVRSITAPLSPVQARRFHQRFGVGVLNSYGQTEIGGEIIGWNASDLRVFGSDKLGAVGRPHDGVELRIEPVGHGAGPGGAGPDEPVEVGELWVRTPAMSAGYASGADLGDRLSPDGFFRTGDLARIDEHGFVWIEGRVSDMVNRGGLKVFPAEVEEALRLHPAVVDAAVAGVPDDRLGEVPVAWVVLRPTERERADVQRLLLSHCREHLAPYKVPARLVVIDELPRNDVGKVLTRQLAEELG